MYIVHPDEASFQKKWEINAYELFEILDRYDDELADSEQEDKWEVWFCNVTIKEIQEYNKKTPDNGIFVYLKDEIPSNEEGG